MKSQKRAVLFVNLGSPASPRIGDVRSYLKEFLSDPKVIDLPAGLRYLLVYGIIAPLRSFRSAKKYKKLFTDRGFPLIFHSSDLVKKLQEHVNDGTDLYLGMRYGEPSLKKTLHQIRNTAYNELLVLPLYPQYASSTTGSVFDMLQAELKGFPIYDNTFVIPHFHDINGFAELWQKKLIACNFAEYDAIVFSYHGIPKRQARAAHPGQSCELLNCTQVCNAANSHCYHSSCYQTTRSVIDGLHIEPEKIHTSFQSRFGKNWLSPFTDQTLTSLAKEGKKNVLIVSPSFVADCLETTVEIAHEYAQLFKDAGGEKLTLVPSLNSDSEWVDFIAGVLSGGSTTELALFA